MHKVGSTQTDSTAGKNQIILAMAGHPKFIVALKSAVFSSQILGVFPYSLQRNSITISFLRLIFVSVLFTLVVGNLAMTNLYCEKDSTDTYFEWEITMTKLTIISITSTGTMLAMLFSGDQLNCWMCATWKSLHVTSGYLQTNFTYHRWESISHFVIFFILFIGEINVYEPIEYIKFYWGFYLSNFIIVAFINQFVGMVDILRQSYHEINRSFSKITLEKLEAFIIAFERLSTASEELNEGYGPQLLLMIGGNFLLVTINAFLIINEPIAGRKFAYGLQCLISGWSPYRLVQACTALVNESKEFNVLLNTTIVDSRNQGFAESARLRLHLSMKKEIQFTARGFFVLDYALVNSMMGAITTYLVILIQFDGSIK